MLEYISITVILHRYFEPCSPLNLQTDDSIITTEFQIVHCAEDGTSCWFTEDKFHVSFEFRECLFKSTNLKLKRQFQR